jgi:hypothetical protein
MNRKSEIVKIADACKLDVQIQSNMPGLRFSVYVTDEARRVRTGSVLYYGGTADTLAFLEGYRTALQHSK